MEFVRSTFMFITCGWWHYVFVRSAASITALYVLIGLYSDVMIRSDARFGFGDRSSRGSLLTIHFVPTFIVSSDLLHTSLNEMIGFVL